MQHDNPWQHLKTEEVYRDEWIVVNHDEVIRPDNDPGTYTYIETKNSVLIIALDNNQEIYMEWTYRYPTKSWGWELPGGGIDDLSDLDTAKSELREECNYTASSWELLGENKLYNGLVTGSVSIYLATGLEPHNYISTDDNEITNSSRFFSVESINEMILKSEIKDSQTIASIHLFELRNRSR